VLFHYGYIEYGYSTSNFAASQADLALAAPTFSVERAGRWVPLRENWGFPGGTPRWMGVDLDGLLAAGDRRLRVETNLEIYWDHAILAAVYRDPRHAGVRIRRVAPAAASLRRLGFPRDGFPDGRHPRVYDYGDVIPFDEYYGRELRPFPGGYTRFGDVLELLEKADDRFAIFGPGDEIALSFPAHAHPSQPTAPGEDAPPGGSGTRRTFFAAAAGWCKDTDLYTAHGESVEPLPFRAMEGYTGARSGAALAAEFAADAGRRATAERYHTRVVPAQWPAAGLRRSASAARPDRPARRAE
jgi:hypothetical protein